MNKTLALVVFIGLLLTACTTKNNLKDIPLEKKYWNYEDYDNVVREIRYGTPENEKMPNYSDPETAPIISKLLDKENISIVLDDNQLGLKHRNEFSNNMFQVYKDLDDAYSILDRQDNFVYPVELVKVKDWGLFLQIKYFKLGNDNILKNAVNTKDSNIVNAIKSNEDAIISNFESSISFLTNEGSLSEDAKNEYSNLLDQNFPKLIETFPNGDYGSMLSTIKNMELKISSSKIKNSLQKIKSLIENKTEKNSAI